MPEALVTTDHEEIKHWVEERGGRPASVKRTGRGSKKKEPGILRIDFPGFGEDEKLDPISWEAFFEKFEKEHLAFLHQDKTDSGEVSRFCKLVDRNSAKTKEKEEG